ncbi:polysaccharide biosynthesis protein [Flavobacterium sp.]|uniref:polysaccharide biosynthesis protein n=1 Tax=Flavobacterium sp. TaxID=239 RepID=UPI003F697E57
MREKYLDKLLKLLFHNRFDNFGYLPRWLIFFIDIVIIVVANALTYMMLKNLTQHFYPTFTFLERYSIVVFVNVLFFVLFRTYAGIVRHSSFVDAVRLLASTFFSFLTLIGLNFLFEVFFDKKVYLISGLVLSFILSFAFLFFFRIFVKYIFENFINADHSKNLIPTIVYGADANAIAIANAIKSEIPSRFKVVAFMGNSKSNRSKSILGLPILYSSKKTSVILRSFSAKALIIAEKSLTKEEKLAIIDDCLNYNIKVYTVPTITNWENENEISKQIKSFEIEDLLERKPIVLDNKLISSQITGKTIFITGAAGSIGSEIVWQLLDFKPKRLLLIDQAETPLHHLFIEINKTIIDKSIEVLPALIDIRDQSCLEGLFSTYTPDLVYHAAAYKHVPLMEENPFQAVNTNVKGTKNMVDLSLKHKVKKFVMVSTDKAVNPSNVMGASKRIAEKYVISMQSKHGDEDTKFITTRFGNVLGSNGSVVPLFKQQIEKGGPITITHPDIIRYFMTIPEACQLVLEAGAMGKGGEIYIFDMGKPVKIIDLARKMIQLAGYEPDKEIQIKIVGLRPGEKLYEELLNDTSKTLPTHHEKIMIAQDLFEDYEANIGHINQLIDLSQNKQPIEIVTKMKVIVPEFLSMNSTYQSLD